MDRLKGWRDDAACVGVPLPVFFPDSNAAKVDPVEHIEYVRNRYCGTCPVLKLCAQDALDHHEGHGIRAGIWISQNSGKAARKALKLVAATGAVPVDKTQPDRGAARWPLCRRGHVKSPDNAREEGTRGWLRCLICERNYRQGRRADGMGKSA